MKTETRNIAMWSGPRNLSTALMRSFDQRRDCQVWDEPFYAVYLKLTHIDHPMREAVINEGIGDVEAVIRACVSAPRAPKTVYYQKHMTQHMVSNIPREWMTQVTNAFLIRSPERVLASYAKKREIVNTEDIGYGRQLELFQRVCDHLGHVPVVVDATDIREAPEAMLSLLCERLGISFDRAMISWREGRSESDGIWGEHWYGNIWKSTGFAPPDKMPAPLPDHLAVIRDEILSDYLAIEKYKLKLEDAESSV